MRRPGSWSGIVLCVLTALFGARVVGQALVAFLEVSWLPSMDDWYSGLLPYRVLLPIQVIILIAQVMVDRDVWRGRGFFARRSDRGGRVLRRLAWIYALAMVVRYAVLRSHPIPIVFHWVLAAYLFTFGQFLSRSHREPRVPPERNLGMIPGAQLVAVLSVALLLQSCTIARYQLKGESENPSPGTTAPCDFTYSLQMTSGRHTNTFGVRETPQKHMKKSRDEPVEATGDVLRNKGCSATYVEREDDATLRVRVAHMLHASALPQEWLTGVSFGLIPSWGTRHAIYVFSFQHANTSKFRRYTVDAKSYNHVILFPLFWITFFTANERNVYKEALTNFLEHS